MNNEPVAWMYKVNDTYTIFNTIEPPNDAYDKGSLISLYNHPAKTLTDEEIGEIANQYLDWIPCGHSEKIVGVTDFARAILRKASEK